MSARLFAAVILAVVGIWTCAAKAARATMPAPKPAQGLKRSLQARWASAKTFTRGSATRHDQLVFKNPARGKTLDANNPWLRALEAYILAQRKGAPLAYGH